MMSDKQKLAVLQQHMEGKKIEQRAILGGGVWREVTTPSWNFHKNEYRVKKNNPNMIMSEGYFVSTIYKNKNGRVFLSRELYDRLKDGAKMVIKIPNTLIQYEYLSEDDIAYYDAPHKLAKKERKNV